MAIFSKQVPKAIKNKSEISISSKKYKKHQYKRRRLTFFKSGTPISDVVNQQTDASLSSPVGISQEVDDVSLASDSQVPQPSLPTPIIDEINRIGYMSNQSTAPTYLSNILQYPGTTPAKKINK
jgi:hypothetical protein